MRWNLIWSSLLGPLFREIGFNQSELGSCWGV